MNRVQTVTQKHYRVKNPGQNPNWLYEPQTGPASAPGAPRPCMAARTARTGAVSQQPLGRVAARAPARLPLMPRAPRAPCAPAAHPARPSACSAPARDTPQRPTPAHPAPSARLRPPRAPSTLRAPQRLPSACTPSSLAQSTKWAVAHQNFSVLKKIFIFHYK